MKLKAGKIYKAGLAALLAAVQVSLFTATQAHGFELFGIHLWGEKKQAQDPDAVIAEPKYYGVNVNITGERGKTDGAVDATTQSIVEASSSLFKDESKPASGSAGLLAKARGDYRRILAGLYSEGRYGGTISIKVDGREASDIPPDAQLPEHVKVDIDVDPGPRFLFSKASIINMAPPPLTEDDRVRSPADAGFAAGELARSDTILRAERLAVEAWKQQGYAKARMSNENIVANHDGNTVSAEITMDPGRKAHYGELAVEGTKRMDPAFVAWMANLKEGQEYDPDDIEKARKRLTRLEVFRALSFQEADEINPDGTLPITLTVQERLPRRFGFGASYSTLDGFGAESYWMHRNLFGKAERLRFDAKVSGIGGSQEKSFDPKNYTYLLGASFTKPGVFTPDTDFVSLVQGKREVLDAYTETSVTAKAGFTHIFSDELSGSLYASVVHGSFDDDYYGKRNFTTAGLDGTLLYDGRNDKNNPTSGYYGEAKLEPFYEMQYGNFAGKVTVEGRTYYGIGKNDRVVLAGRVKLGSIAGAPVSELPPDKLFFAGGGGSVRGYAYRNIGVDVGNGKIVGGRSLLEGSAEIRTKVTETIGVVGFADAGYVGANTFPSFSEDMSVGVGAGLRYYTSLGPIRFDVAVPLERRSGDPKVGFYVGIGQAF